MRGTVLLLLLASGCRRSPSATTGRDVRPEIVVPPASAPTASTIVAVDAGPPQDAAPEPTYASRVLPFEGADPMRLGKAPSFPAVNREGTEVVMLAHDQVDFAGTAVEHVVFLDVKTGRRTFDAMIYDELAERDANPTRLATLRRQHALNAAKAAKRVDATTWRTLEARSTTEPSDPHPHPLQAIDAGTDIRLYFGSDLGVDLPYGAGSEEGVATLEVRRIKEGRITSSPLRIRVPRLATFMGSNKPCGSVRELEGWADPERRFVILVFGALLSGDACLGVFESDATRLLPLPQ